MVIGGLYAKHIFLTPKAPFSEPTNTAPTINYAPCLHGGEYADYPRKNKFYSFLTEPTVIPTPISIYDSSGRKLGQFLISDIPKGNGHPLELHNCGIYALRIFNFDENASRALPDFSSELWRFDYKGSGTKLIQLAALKDKSVPNGALSPDFGYDFMVDPTESFVALRSGYIGSSDYAFVVKDLRSLKDAFILPVANILKQNPNVGGDLGFLESGGWSSDSRYFWFSLNQGANIVGFARVDTKDWSYRVFQAPQITMGGDAFNPNTGMVTYGTNVAPWTGSAELDQQFRNEAKQSGQVTSFYIYNFLTKQNYLVATTTDPTYYFQPRWLSDTVLQYTLPSGATSTYTLPQ